MTEVYAQLRELENYGETVFLWCPGCDSVHQVNHMWEWGWGDFEDITALTISPSILVQGGARGTRCHSFFEEGQWRFLTDCTHHLAGQTAPAVPLPDWLIKEATP